MATRRAFKLYVGNLPWTVAANELNQYFSQFGPVVTAFVPFDKTTGFSRNYGFVTMRSKEGVDNIFSKPSHELEGRILNVSYPNK